MSTWRPALPLAPAQNRLTVAIEAGEKTPVFCAAVRRVLASLLVPGGAA